jgi:hypothetical protein
MNVAPYLALHNNKNGWHGNGGSGGISVLNKGEHYFNNGVRSVFSILFPIGEKKKYKKLVDIVAKSFKPSFGEQ